MRIGTAGGLHSAGRVGVDALEHIERLARGICEEPVPGEDVGAPDVGGLQDGEPVRW